MTTQHLTDKSTYYWVTAGLFLLLALTVVAAQLEAGSWNVPIALAIAAAKTALIAIYFMHLRFSSPLVRIFAAAGCVWLLFLLIFLAADVMSRGWVG